MYSIAFVSAFVFTFIAGVIFCLGLYKVVKRDQNARDFITGGFMVWLVGVFVTTILFLFFT